MLQNRGMRNKPFPGGNGTGRALAAVLWIWGAALASAAVGAPPPREPVLGGPCEGCEHVFSGMPDSLETRARIVDPVSGDEPMALEGRVTTRDGEPAPGIVVYAYHTDSGGIYPREDGDTPHGRLRGWALTDGEGRYRFDTIRPGGYPGTGIAQHVHMHVLEPGVGTYYIDDVIFDDDPRLTEAVRPGYMKGRGGTGLAVPEKDEQGVWRVRRDIVLGRNIPGYPDPARRKDLLRSRP